MKVVLFCGGLGTRLREHSDTIPKPLVTIGHRPILWHLMRYYAHYGHKEFVLCLGYMGDLIREYFLNYSEYLSNDFTLRDGGRTLELHRSDIQDWVITFVDTGLHSNIGERLLRVRHLLEDEPMFMANYADGLSDLNLDAYIDDFRARDALASFVSVRSPQSFHVAESTSEGVVTRIAPLGGAEAYINGGFFVFRNGIYKYIEEGDELVEKPFERLIAQGLLHTYRHEGLWRPMDTFKDKIAYDRMASAEDCPWMVWKR
jgi:glucose-1-phosphate cytidylyltransferase